MENTVQFLSKDSTGTYVKIIPSKQQQKNTKTEKAQIPKREFHFLPALDLVPETISHANVF